jgi:hypothetical protein
MSAEGLEAALLATGIAADVEARVRLAIITPRDDASSRAIAERRDSVVTLASLHGFSHVALEIGARPRASDSARSDAALPGD